MRVAEARLPLGARHHLLRLAAREGLDRVEVLGEVHDGGVLDDLAVEFLPGLVHAFKRRVTRKIRLDAIGRDEEVPASGKASFVDRGLQIELTRVHLDDPEVRDSRRRAWTLGFEAFPIDPDMHEAFARNVGAFLRDFGTHRLLTRRASASQPGMIVHRPHGANMTEPQTIWTEQCEAAERICGSFGEEKALGYLIGEKLAEFVRVADTRPEWAAELPAFLAEVRRLFGVETIESYLGRIRRLGPFAHIGTESDIAELRAGGMFGEEDPVEDAEDILLVERLREMLLG